jgi:hypothetical protein
MYAYIDETGNTGENLFDSAQPFFMTAALMTRGKFDLIYGGRISTLARRLGVDILHSNELGLHRIEEIAPQLLKAVKDARSSFIISHIVKRDLAVSKLVDTIFDNGENLAVPWQAYNARPLRYLLVFKIAALLDDELLAEFWGTLMERNKNLAYDRFRNVLREILARVHFLPDARSRELISEALTWALGNIEAIHVHSSSKAARYGHLPNMAAFTPVLRGIDRRSQQWGVSVDEIIHDRQSQFGFTLKELHKIYSSAKPKEVHWPFEDEPFTFFGAYGSKFKISDKKGSAGIQVIDIVLWLLRKTMQGESLPPKSSKFLNYVVSKAYGHVISLENMSKELSEVMQKLEEAPITEEQLQKAQELLQISEERRKEAMLSYDAQKKLLGNNLDIF